MTVRKPLAVFQAEGVHEKVKNVENVEMRGDGRGLMPLLSITFG